MVSTVMHFRTPIKTGREGESVNRHSGLMATFYPEGTEILSTYQLVLVRSAMFRFVSIGLTIIAAEESSQWYMYMWLYYTFGTHQMKLFHNAIKC
jgi:hypothetical protein